MIIQLAWKNIWRNKLRSMVILIAIMLGLIAGIFIVSFMNGIVSQRIQDVINIEMSHLQINTQSFIDNQDVEDVFYYPVLEDSIKTMKEVAGVSPRIVLSAMASSPHQTGGIQLIAIDPEKEKMVTQLYKCIPDSMGNYFTNVVTNAVIVGRKFAEKYHIKEKSKIILSMVDNYGEQVSGAFRVSGIFTTNNPMFEEMTLFVNINDIRNLTGISQDSVHELGIRLVDNKMQTLQRAQSHIKNLLNNREVVRNWIEISPLMGLYTGFMQIELMIIVAIILCALGFGIVNTILMSVMERKREISMLIAIGMNRKKVMYMIILESTILTMLGGFLGMLIGLIITFITHKTGIDMSNSFSSHQQYGISTNIHPEITISQFLMIAIMVILTGILSAIYPARHAMKLNPAEGIR